VIFPAFPANVPRRKLNRRCSASNWLNELSKKLGRVSETRPFDLLDEFPSALSENLTRKLGERPAGQSVLDHMLGASGIRPIHLFAFDAEF
jgi:hypothetical protein